MNRNKRNKNKKVNEAISNMGSSTSFQSLSNSSNTQDKSLTKIESHTDNTAY
ncbi:hypothetical protein [Clostridium sp.]|uniref:hypothetical protein n=1 Tax=Clostridium sp. TaxID=1506 RepID=UPI002FC894B6